jgi:hypothetical protein
MTIFFMIFYLEMPQLRENRLAAMVAGLMYGIGTSIARSNKNPVSDGSIERVLLAIGVGFLINAGPLDKLFEVLKSHTSPGCQGKGQSQQDKKKRPHRGAD